jgi:hexokinase
MSIPSAEFTKAQTAAVEAVLEKFNTSTECLTKISDKFVKEMEKGLDHEGATGKYFIK